MTDARREPPLMIPPDPEVVAEALTGLMFSAAAAVQATTRKALSAEPLPYDPTTVARAWWDFNTAVMTSPAALMQAQMQGWQDWTAL